MKREKPAMRKPIIIEESKATMLYKYVNEKLWLSKSAAFTKGGVVMLIGDARKVITAVLNECEAADKELGFGPESKEQSARQYLKTLIS